MTERSDTEGSRAGGAGAVVVLMGLLACGATAACEGSEAAASNEAPLDVDEISSDDGETLDVAGLDVHAADVRDTRDGEGDLGDGKAGFRLSEPATLGLPCIRKRGPLTEEGASLDVLDRYEYEVRPGRVLIRRLDKRDDGDVDAIKYRKYTAFGKVEKTKTHYKGDDEYEVQTRYSYTDDQRLSREWSDTGLDGIYERRVSFVYDSNGRRTKVLREFLGGGTFELVDFSELDRGNDGRVNRIRHYTAVDGSEEDAKLNQVSRFEYRRDGRVKIRKTDSDPDGIADFKDHVYFDSRGRKTRRERYRNNREDGSARWEPDYARVWRYDCSDDS